MKHAIYLCFRLDNMYRSVISLLSSKIKVLDPSLLDILYRRLTSQTLHLNLVVLT